MQHITRISFAAIVLLMGCGQRAPIPSQQQNKSTSTPIFISTFTPSPDLFATNLAVQLTIDSLPTATITPPPTPFPAIRNTPATLMLHKSSEAFNSIEFLREFIAILKENDFQVVTYRYISEHPDVTATNRGRLAIITIDDIYLQYGFASSISEMIDILADANCPAVLGVITEGYYADPALVARLQSLSDIGWEIATHTDQHENLGEMEKSAPRYIYTEIKTSQDKIEAAIGVRPITLILPEGQMTDDSTQIVRAGIVWIVGINGGTTYNINKKFYYVGRESPSIDSQTTYKYMMQRFNP